MVYNGWEMLLYLSPLLSISLCLTDCERWLQMTVMRPLHQRSVCYYMSSESLTDDDVIGQDIHFLSVHIREMRRVTAASDADKGSQLWMSVYLGM